MTKEQYSVIKAGMEKDIAKKIQDKTNKCGKCYFYNTVKERVVN